MFNIPEQKGWYPHLFNTLDNIDYEGPLPAIEYFCPDSKSPSERKKLLEWHQSQKDSNFVFNNRAELIKYCKTDVEILRIYAYIADVETAITIMKTDIRNAQYAFILKSQSQDMMSFVLMLMQSYQTKQRNFLEALSLATKGGNSPIIIPPEVIMNELAKIRHAMAGKKVDLPIPLSKDNLAHYYQLVWVMPYIHIYDLTI